MLKDGTPPARLRVAHLFLIAFMARARLTEHACGVNVSLSPTASGWEGSPLRASTLHSGTSFGGGRGREGPRGAGSWGARWMWWIFLKGLRETTSRWLSVRAPRGARPLHYNERVACLQKMHHQQELLTLTGCVRNWEAVSSSYSPASMWFQTIRTHTVLSLSPIDKWAMTS